MDRVEVLANYAYHSDWCTVADPVTPPSAPCEDDSCQKYRNEQAQRLEEALSAWERSRSIQALTVDPEVLLAMIVHHSGGQVEVPSHSLIDPPPLEVITWTKEGDTVVFKTRILTEQNPSTTQPEGEQHDREDPR